ncbi:unknown function [Klebsiella phage vB_Kpn_K27PH129C1]|uniref:Uncharacterized protein n=1 Tax=Klebsiella phage vB_Kpn_K27PH129C1 TaxID=3071640 RepID=A0AAV1MDT4_9CAUD|nr:unknown function [Klebsiella phage vB_Kpn_K27PH129C1]
MKLTKETAVEIRKALSDKDLLGIAAVYKEKGLTFTRFIWDAYHSMGHANTRDIIARNNDVEIVGGYITDLKDSHIETMLKVAFKDLQY